ncbi:hypothetical protein Patl1_00801 [Pistacia atlantica]|uniref:Uncharacterized protein n=1 Tax=Pistacia atlantica TaxID=434234 RepID=A0ACC1C8C9_9ROSI|nr:hypothetical protein Patl1_00801 [Pistacia atlantica]
MGTSAADFNEKRRTNNIFWRLGSALQASLFNILR